MIWETMRLLYGAAFQQAYGEAPNAVWLDAIAGLTDEECAAGFRRLRDEPRRFPPNLTEFLGACRPKAAGVRFLGVPVTAQERARMLAPPDRRAKPHVIENWLQRIRARLAPKGDE